MKKKLFSLLTLLLCVASGAWATDFTVVGPTANVNTENGVTIAGTKANLPFTSSGKQDCFTLNSASSVWIYSLRTNITAISFDIVRNTNGSSKSSAVTMTVATGGIFSTPTSGFSATNDGSSIASLSGITAIGNNQTNATTISVSFSSAVKSVVLTQTSSCAIRNITVTYNNSVAYPITYFAAHISGEDAATIDTNPGGASTTVDTSGETSMLDGTWYKLNAAVTIDLGEGHVFEVGDQIAIDIAAGGTNKTNKATKIQTSGGTDVVSLSTGALSNAVAFKHFYIVKADDGIAGKQSAKFASGATDCRYYSYSVLRTAVTQVATPTITPATFSAASQEVTISCATAGATIHYTLDGTTPTESSAVYNPESKPSISSTTTVKAIAIKDGLDDSEIATATIKKVIPTVLNSWNFTNWSDATKTGIFADDTNWSVYEKIDKDVESSDLSGKVQTNKVAKEGTLVYGSTNIAETDGLNFNIATHTLGIAYNQGSTDLGTYYGSQYLWLYNSSSKVIIPSVPAGATIEIGLESHKLDGTDDATRTLNVTNTDKGSVSTDAYTEETFTVSTTGNVTIYPSKGMHIYYITVKTNVETVPITIASGKEYTTLTSASNLDFTEVDDLKPYVVTADISDDKVTLSQRNKIAAGNGMVLKAETTGKTYNVPVFTGDGDDVTGNKMEGSATETTYIAENAGYILKSGVFQPSAGGYLPAGKAYLNVAVTEAHALTITFENESGETTSITGVEAKKYVENNKFYNLNGQIVENPTKGLYIVNGKKVIIK